MAYRATELREAARAAATAKPPPLAPRPTSLPQARKCEKENGPLSQEPINQALRNAAGK